MFRSLQSFLGILSLFIALTWCSTYTIYVDHGFDGDPLGTIDFPFHSLDNLKDLPDVDNIEVVFVTFLNDENLSWNLSPLSSISFSSKSDHFFHPSPSSPTINFPDFFLPIDVYLSNVSVSHISANRVFAIDSFIQESRDIMDLQLTNSSFSVVPDSNVCSLTAFNCDSITGGFVFASLVHNVNHYESSLPAVSVALFSGLLNKINVVTELGPLSSICEPPDFSRPRLEITSASVGSIDIDTSLINFEVISQNSVFNSIHFITRQGGSVYLENVTCSTTFTSVGQFSFVDFFNVESKEIYLRASILVFLNCSFQSGDVVTVTADIHQLSLIHDDETFFPPSFKISANFLVINGLRISTGSSLVTYGGWVELYTIETVKLPFNMDPPYIEVSTEILTISDSELVGDIPLFLLKPISSRMFINLRGLSLSNIIRPIFLVPHHPFGMFHVFDCSFTSSSSSFIFNLPESRSRSTSRSEIIVESSTFTNVVGVFNNAEEHVKVVNCTFDGLTGILFQFLTLPMQSLDISFTNTTFVGIENHYTIMVNNYASCVVFIEDSTFIDSSFYTFLSVDYTNLVTVEFKQVDVLDTSFFSLIDVLQGHVNLHISNLTISNSWTYFGVIDGFSASIVVSHLLVSDTRSSNTLLFHLDNNLSLVLNNSLFIQDSFAYSGLMFADSLNVSSIAKDSKILIHNFDSHSTTFSYSRFLSLILINMSFDVKTNSKIFFSVQSSTLIETATSLNGQCLLVGPLIQTATLSTDKLSVDSLSGLTLNSFVASVKSSSIDHHSVRPLPSIGHSDSPSISLECHDLFFGSTKPLSSGLNFCSLVSNISLLNTAHSSWIFYRLQHNSYALILTESLEIRIGNTFRYPLPLRFMNVLRGVSFTLEVSFFEVTRFFTYTFPYCSAGFEFVNNQCQACPYGTIQTQFNYKGKCLTQGSVRDTSFTGNLYDVPASFFVKELINSTKLVRCLKPQFCTGGLVPAGFSTASIHVLPPTLVLESVLNGTAFDFRSGCASLHYGPHCSFCEDVWIPAYMYLGEATIYKSGSRPVIRDFATGTCILCSSLVNLILSVLVLLLSSSLVLYTVFHQSFRHSLLRVIPVVGDASLRNWLRRSFVVFSPLFTSSLFFLHQNRAFDSVAPQTLHYSPVHAILCLARYKNYQWDKYSFHSFIFFILVLSMLSMCAFFVFYAVLLLMDRKKANGNFVLLLKAKNVFYRQIEYVVFVFLPFLAGFAALPIVDTLDSFIGDEAFSLDPRYADSANIIVSFGCLLIISLLVVYLWILPKFHKNILEETVYKNQSALFDMFVTTGRTFLLASGNIFGHNIVFLLLVYFVCVGFLLMFLRPYSIEYFNDFSARLVTVVILFVTYLSSFSGNSNTMSHILLLILIPCSFCILCMRSRSQGVVRLRQKEAGGILKNSHFSLTVL
ncbi:hypothetical protein RCL1_002831 [Eukaryota sp. TZLM3-RCL]